jgi:hypothetical protein
MLHHSLATLRCNPFDEGPFEEVLPDHWHGPHVGLRLADAFITLRRLPMSERTYRTCWPAYANDVNAEQNDALSLGELELQQDARNRTHILPSAVEISQCDEAIGWPARYLKKDRNLARAVQFAARWGDYGRIAKKRGGTADLWQIRNWTGTALIADGLNRDGVRVF